MYFIFNINSYMNFIVFLGWIVIAILLFFYGFYFLIVSQDIRPLNKVKFFNGIILIVLAVFTVGLLLDYEAHEKMLIPLFFWICSTVYLFDLEKKNSRKQRYLEFLAYEAVRNNLKTNQIIQITELHQLEKDKKKYSKKDYLEQHHILQQDVFQYYMRAYSDYPAFGFDFCYELEKDSNEYSGPNAYGDIIIHANDSPFDYNDISNPNISTRDIELLTSKNKPDFISMFRLGEIKEGDTFRVYAILPKSSRQENMSNFKDGDDGYITLISIKSDGDYGYTYIFEMSVGEKYSFDSAYCPAFIEKICITIY